MRCCGGCGTVNAVPGGTQIGCPTMDKPADEREDISQLEGKIRGTSAPHRWKSGGSMPPGVDGK